MNHPIDIATVDTNMSGKVVTFLGLHVNTQTVLKFPDFVKYHSVRKCNERSVFHTRIQKFLIFPDRSVVQNSYELDMSNHSAKPALACACRHLPFPPKTAIRKRSLWVQADTTTPLNSSRWGGGG